MIKTFEYRMYPNKEQTLIFENWIAACRNLYNQALDWKNQHYQETGEPIGIKTQGKALTALRAEKAFWSAIPMDCLQDSLRRLHKAYQAFYRRVKSGETPGFPRFKGPGRYRSISFAHVSQNLIREIGGRLARLSVPKLGLVKIRYHRPLPRGRIKGFSVRRKASGWYVMIHIEVDKPIKQPPRTAMGIDVGLESFLTTSEGTKVEPPQYFRISEVKLAKWQRRKAKKKERSYQHRLLTYQVAKLHEHVANQRKDFHYKLIHKLFQLADLIAIEDLQVQNMIRNKRLSKSIADVGWGNFRLKLESKAESAGKIVEAVNPKHTSQKCSNCGVTVKKELSDRVHDCLHCGVVLDRDHNAAINILRAALAQRGEPGVVKPLEKLSGERSAKSESKATGYMPNALALGS